MTPPNPTSSSCQNCRWSRVRCDATRPVCRRCAFDGVDCLGYGPPLLWVQPETLHGQRNQSDGSGGLRPCRKRGRPKLILAESSANPVGRRMDTGRSFAILTTSQHNLDTRPLHPLPKGLAMANYTDVNFTLHCLSYYNTHVCPDFVAVDSPKNPHRIDLNIWHLMPNFLLSMIAAISTTHQIIRSQSGNVLLTDGAASTSERSLVEKQFSRLESFRHPLMTKVYRYQQQALQGLNGYLQIHELQLLDMTIGLIALLLMAEVQQSAHGVWWAHWEAIREIVVLRGGFAEVVSTNCSSHLPLSIFMLMDVMSCVTKPSRSISDRAYLQLQYVDLLSTLYHDGTDTGFPCPNELVEFIICVNNLRALSHTSPNNDYMDIDRRVLHLIQEIVCFSPGLWIQRRNVLESGEDGARSGDDFLITYYPLTVPADRLVAVEEGSWASLGFMLQAAVLLYATRCLILDRGAPIIACMSPTDLTERPTIDVHALRSAADEMLFNGFRRFFPANGRQGLWIGKFLFWPLFIAGMECCSGAESAGKRELVTLALGDLAYYLGDLSLIDAVSFLRSLWQMEDDMWRNDAAGERNCGTVHSRTWDDKVSCLREHSVFFI